MQVDFDNRLGTVVPGGLLGLAVGDALGVPVEFVPRELLKKDPVTGTRGHGTYDQPPGTWSDDTSLTLCLAESFCEAGIDYADQARRFVGWLQRGEWTPHGKVFDKGNATSEAIHRLGAGIEPTSAGRTDERSCGNGSLMRILPVGLYLAWAETAERIDIAMKCSRLTHGHPRSQLACAFYVEVVAAVVRGASLPEALHATQMTMASLVNERYPAEKPAFTRLLSDDLPELPEEELSSSGYVIHCLEASLWAALQATSYFDGVLQAVNLGEDTDTTGAVTGGLLGVCFGLDAIPSEWQAALARRDDLLSLCDRFQDACRRRWESDR